MEQYAAAHPHSRAARVLLYLDTLSNSALQALLAEAEARLGEAS
jgi:hypothetical protein